MKKLLPLIILLLTKFGASAAIRYIANAMGSNNSEPGYKLSALPAWGKVFFCFLITLSLLNTNTNAQAPAISYGSPQIYGKGITISNLSPTNSGGAASPAFFGPVTTVGSASEFSNPQGVAVDASGNLYVADYAHNQIKEIAADGGAITAIATGALAIQPVGIAVDASGNVYIARLDGALFKRTPSNNFIQLATGLGTLFGVAVDATGNVYAVSNGNKEIYKNGNPVLALSGSPTGITIDPSGNIYELETPSSSSINNIQSSNLTESPFGSFTDAYYGIAVDASGNVYVADRTNNTVEKISAVTHTVSTVVSNLNQPAGVALDASGSTLYVADAGNGLVKKIPISSYTIAPALPAGLSFNTATGVISGTPTAISPNTAYTITAYNDAGSSIVTLNIAVNPVPVPAIAYTGPQIYSKGVTISNLSPTNSGGAVTPVGTLTPVGSASEFNNPQGVAVDASGNLYVADYAHNAIKKVTADGSAITTLASGIAQPVGIATDASGNVYQAGLNGELDEITPAGNVIQLATGLGTLFGVAVDGTGNVYTVSNNRKIIFKLLGINSLNFASLSASPTGIAIDPSGNIFVSEAGSSSSINNIQSSNLTESPFGSFTDGYYGIAVDASGNVYVADRTNNTVEKISAVTHTVSTVVSNLNQPAGVALDASGSTLYVADATNNLVKRIQASSYTIAPALPAGLSFNTATGVISGTPTAISPNTAYTIAAYNTGGSSTTTVNIAVTGPDVNGVLYVKKGSSGDGSSWASAIGEVKDALTAAATLNTAAPGTVKQVWVAAGTYQPNAGASFSMLNKVHIYGGFAGTETVFANRNWLTNATVLKGNNNSVIINNSLDTSAVLDGFTVTGGAAPSSMSGGGIRNSSSSPTLNNLVISGNTANVTGGGIETISASSPLITNVIISGNSSFGGGGIDIQDGCSPVLTNVIISGNSASSGGGISMGFCSPSFTNVTISGNNASNGGAVSVFGNISSPQFKNSIIYGNSSGISGSGSVITYSSVQGGYAGIGNLATDPQFTNAPDYSTAPFTSGDYTLKATSPAINAGDPQTNTNGYAVQAGATDFAGNTRIQKGRIDMGANESAGSPAPQVDANGVVYVKSGSAGNGNSWANAFGQVSDALAGAATLNGTTPGTVKQIWVAAGTYQPNVNSSFYMLNNVAIYGGFAGTETTLASRNPKINLTVLKGNSSSVIYNDGNGLTPSALLDGFTITGGMGLGSAGGGMYNNAVSPTVNNCIFSGNTAQFGGAIQNSSSSPIITNCTFVGNTATQQGGGIESEFTPNTGTALVIANCIFIANSAPLGGGITNYETKTSITNCTFSGNTGNAEINVDADAQDPLTITNSILWNTSGNNIPEIMIRSGTITVNYSIVKGTSVYPGTGNSNTDPLFSNPSANDYTLQACNPANNSGDPQTNNSGYSIQAGSTDLSGNTRIIAGSIDIGAYETQSISVVMVVNTGTATNITGMTGSAALLGGSVFCDGGSAITERGIVYATTANPVTSNNKAIAGNGRGVFSQTITGLTGNTLYHFRAYAVNSAGTVYGADQTFTTLFPPVIAYAGPQTYTTGVAISNLSPTNSGGAVSSGNGPVTTVGSGFSNPQGVTVDASGKVYVADYNNNAIKNIAADNTITIVGGASINQPVGIAADVSGNLYVAGLDGTVSKITASGVISQLVSGLGTLFGVAVDGTGNVYTVSNNGKIIFKILGINSSSPVNLSASPTGIAIDPSGNIFVSEAGSSSSIKNVVFSSSTETPFGSFTADYYGIAVDAAGNVYVANRDNNTVEKIAASTRTVSAVISGLNSPAGVALDASGRTLYVSDAGNGLVKKITMFGYTVTPALPSGLSLDPVTGVISGTPTAASPNTVYAITANNAGGNSTTMVNIAVVSPPIIASISPAKAFAGNTVTITGTNFTGATAVSFGGTAATSFTVVSATSITAVVGAGSSGNVSVTAPGGTVTFAGFVFISADVNGVLYVKKGATGGGGSWADALGELGDALADATTINTASPGTVKEIWVSKGTYKPLYKAGNGTVAEDMAFVLLKNVNLYGGFAGTETAFTQRDATKVATVNQTILSGDIDNNDGAGGQINGSNAYHVLIAAGDVGTAIVDGFMVNGGSATDNAGGFTVNGASVSRNAGGGIAISTSSPVIRNNIFSGNTAAAGGGIGVAGGSPVIINDLITGNSVSSTGAGIYNTGGSLIIRNSTISSNKSAFNTGGISSTVGGVTITNSIVYGNQNGGISGLSSITYTLTQDVTSGTGNLNADPKFTNAPSYTTAPFIGGDYTILAGSPAINAGDPQTNNTGYATQVGNTDVAGNTRIFDSRIDIGAYERQMNQQVISFANVVANKIIATYGDADFSPATSSLAGATITYSVPVGNTVATIVNGNIHITGAGEVAVTTNAAGNSQYDPALPVVTTLHVNTKDLTITANNVNKTYGTAITGAAGSTAFSSSGLVNSETIGTLTIAYGTGAAATAAVNTYTGSVVASAATGGTFTGSNYNITYAPGNIIVGQANLTITATGPLKTYGTALTAGTSTTNFTTATTISGETVTSVTLTPDAVGLSATTAAGQSYAVTPSLATGTGGFLASNYNITYTPFTGTVDTKTLTITATGPSKSYGTALTAGTSTTNFTTATTISGETVTSVTLTPDAAGLSATTAAGLSYTVTPSLATGTGGFLASNYNITYTPFTGTVDTKTLTITATGPSKSYGTALTAGTSTTNFTTGTTISGETVTSVTLTPDAAGLSATTAAGLSYAVTPSLATGTGGFLASNYNITYTPFTGTAGTKALTITATGPSKTYGTALTTGTSTTNFTTGTTVSGETVTSVTLTPNAAGLSAITAANAAYIITPSAATGTGGFLASNYAITYVPFNGAVSQANLTITANNVNKTYGAAITGVAGSTAFSSSGLVNSETIGTVTVAYGTGAAAIAAVNTYTGSVIPTSATGGTFTASNYNITYAPGDIIVGTANLTITANTVNKTYGAAITGAAGSTAFGSSGLVNSETIGTVTIAYGTGAAAIAAVNTYTGSVIPTSATGGTFTASNYNITYAPGDIIVGTANLTITANTVNKTYGAAITGAAGSTAFGSSGLVNSETIGTVTIAYGTGAAATAAVNTYTGSVVPTLATGGTFTASNYNITYAPGNIIVGTANLTITANNVNKTYGVAITGAAGSTAFGSSGLVNSETIGTVTVAYGTGAAATAAVNTYTGSVVPTLAIGGTFTASNYNITYAPGDIIVGTANLTITANDQIKTYGDAFSFTGTEFTSTGLTNGDVVSSVTLTSTGATALAMASSTPYDIELSAATGIGLSNYAITYQKGKLAVGQKILTIINTDRAKTYGNALTNVDFTGGIIGIVNSDNITITRSSTGGVATAAVGATYPIVAAISDPDSKLSNYAVTNNDGTLTVGQKALTITANNQSKTYGDVFIFTGTEFTSNGLINNNAINSVTLTSAGSQAPATASTIPYDINVSNATGIGLSNYAITYITGGLTVGQKTLVVVNTDRSKVYGDVLTNTDFSGNITGIANNDNITVSRSSTGTSPSATAGTYSIVATLADPDNKLPNYAVTNNNGMLTVGRKRLTITANDQTKTYGDLLTFAGTEFASIGLTGTDAVNNVMLNSPGAATTAAASLTPYVINISAATGTGLSNYDIAYNTGNLTVTPATLTGVSLGDAAFTYDGNLHSLTVTNLPQGATVRYINNGQTNAGAYPVTAIVSQANYNDLNLNAQLLINKAQAVITATATQTFTYDGTPKTVTASLNHNETVLSYSPQQSYTNAGVYPVTINLAATADYLSASQLVTLTISPATITGVTLADATFNYDANPHTTIVAGLPAGAVVSYTNNGQVNAGTYTVTATVSEANYTDLILTAQLIITQQAPVLTFAALPPKTYGAADFSAGAVSNVSGALTYASSNPAVAVVSAQGDIHITGAGNTTITVSQAAVANYQATSLSQVLTVAKTQLTITADNKSRPYGTANPALTVTYNGFVNGEDISALTTPATATTAATVRTMPGSYVITPAGCASGNYTFNYVTGTLFVIPLSNATMAGLTLSAGTLSPVFAGGIYSYTASVENIVEYITLTPVFDPTASATINGAPVPNGSTSYSIHLNAGNNTITIVVTAQDGVTQNTYTVTIYRAQPVDEITATNILSPNGDGANDYWVIKDILLYPNNTVTIYDRAGRIVYTKKNYTNDWGGTFKGAPLAEDTYYYVVYLADDRPPIRGFITIVRNRR